VPSRRVGRGLELRSAWRCEQREGTAGRAARSSTSRSCLASPGFAASRSTVPAGYQTTEPTQSSSRRREGHACAQQSRSNSALRIHMNHHASAVLLWCNALYARLCGGRCGEPPRVQWRLNSVARVVVGDRRLRARPAGGGPGRRAAAGGHTSRPTPGWPAPGRPGRARGRGGGSARSCTARSCFRPGRYRRSHRGSRPR
jgi:hypothetical protein